MTRPNAQRLLESLRSARQEVQAQCEQITEAAAQEPVNENLHKWFKEKWVRFGPDGKIRGDCARGDGSEGKPKCLPQSKAHSLGKAGRKYAAAKKRREDPNPERSGAAINVATKKKTSESKLDEKCWDTHRQAGMKRKGDRMVPNCVPRESQEQCPECGGEMYPDSMILEKQDACYYKVKSRYKVWPSAYASGALVQCRKKGAKNWGNKNEAANPAQQAAIAIAMKKAGQKPKSQGVAEADIGGATMKRIQVGDIVKYFGEKVEVLEISPKNNFARISGGGRTLNVKLSDLKQFGRGIAEGATELLKAEMPLIRHIEKELAQYGYEKGTPEYDEKYKHLIAMYRKFGNVDAINQGVAEAHPNQQIARYKPDGTTYRGTANKMPTLDPEDPVHNATRFGPEHDQSYEQDFDKEGLKRVAANAIASLPKIEQQIIKLHMWHGVSLDEIGKRLGVSQSRVRQIEEKALSKLRASADLKSFAEQDSKKIMTNPQPTQGEWDAMVRRIGQRAKAGPMVTVRDPETGRTRNIPTKTKQS